MVQACTGFISPLDLQCIFVNFFAGDWVIFGLLALFFIVSVAGTFRMSNVVTGASIILFAVIFYGELPWLGYLAILIGAIIIWGAATALWKR